MTKAIMQLFMPIFVTLSVLCEDVCVCTCMFEYSILCFLTFLPVCLSGADRGTSSFHVCIAPSYEWRTCAMEASFGILIPVRVWTFVFWNLFVCRLQSAIRWASSGQNKDQHLWPLSSMLANMCYSACPAHLSLHGAKRGLAIEKALFPCYPGYRGPMVWSICMWNVTFRFDKSVYHPPLTRVWPDVCICIMSCLYFNEPMWKNVIHKPGSAHVRRRPSRDS